MQNKNVTRCPQKTIKEAAKQFATPFFLYEETQIRKNCQRATKAFSKYFQDFTPLYAIKANANPHLVKIIMDEGFGIDASSPAEAYITQKLGGWGMYTGNYTPIDEFEFVLKNKKILLNLDDISMIPTVKKLGMPNFISFRINPGISKGGMKSLFFAGEDAKYGVPYEKAIEAYSEAKKAGAKKFGIHMMTGSNVLDEEYFPQVTKKLLEIAGGVKKALGIDFEYINIGGGFGAPYKPEEKSLDIELAAKRIKETFDQICPKYNLASPKLMIEPGRFITADAGFLVAKVHVIKESYNKFAGVDAGMNDLPRPAIYGAYHHITVIGKTKNAKKEKINIVGRLCENNDQFAIKRILPKINIGDYIAIHNSGGHAFAMGHNYNNRPRSAEYLLTQKGKFKKIRRAETIKDLFQTIVGKYQYKISNS